MEPQNFDCFCKALVPESLKRQDFVIADLKSLEIVILLSTSLMMLGPKILVFMPDHFELLSLNFPLAPIPVAQFHLLRPRLRGDFPGFLRESLGCSKLVDWWDHSMLCLKVDLNSNHFHLIRLRSLGQRSSIFDYISKSYQDLN